MPYHSFGFYFPTSTKSAIACYFCSRHFWFWCYCEAIIAHSTKAQLAEWPIVAAQLF
jgi:hypothetical protein